MNPQRLLFLIAIVVLTSSGCAHVPPRQRLSRVLVATGVAVAVTGSVIATGCVPDDRPGACSATGDDGTVKVGFPLVGLGVAIITGALLVRPPAAVPQGPPIMRHATPGYKDPYGPPPLNGY